MYESCFVILYVLQAPSSLLEALEQHLLALEGKKGATTPTSKYVVYQLEMIWCCKWKLMLVISLVSSGCLHAYCLQLRMIITIPNKKSKVPRKYFSLKDKCQQKLELGLVMWHDVNFWSYGRTFKYYFFVSFLNSGYTVKDKILLHVNWRSGSQEFRKWDSCVFIHSLVP